MSAPPTKDKSRRTRRRRVGSPDSSDHDASDSSLTTASDPESSEDEEEVVPQPQGKVYTEEQTRRYEEKKAALKAKRAVKKLANRKDRGELVASTSNLDGSRSGRDAYSERLAADPKFTPRVGGFWTHDQRHYQAGDVQEGGYNGLRHMSGYWRGRGRGRKGVATMELTNQEEGEKQLEMDKLDRPERAAPPAKPKKEMKWGHEGFESMTAVDQFQANRRGRGRGPRPVRGRPSHPTDTRGATETHATRPAADSLLDDDSVKVALPASTRQLVTTSKEFHPRQPPPGSTPQPPQPPPQLHIPAPFVPGHGYHPVYPPASATSYPGEFFTPARPSKVSIRPPSGPPEPYAEERGATYYYAYAPTNGYAQGSYGYWPGMQYGYDEYYGWQ